MKVKQYSELSLGIDLILDVYKITNPVLIVEKLEEDFGMKCTIHQVNDYMDINRKEDYESINRKQYYSFQY
jgi:hypothetical protein